MGVTLGEKDKLIHIDILYFFAGYGAFFTAILFYHRNSIHLKEISNQTESIQVQTRQQQREDETQKNQQFLDAIKLFGENTNLEAKKGALFHLENLALSSPAHRQRVLDFINSLNRWMTSDETVLEKLKEKTDEAWGKWRNERKKFEDLGIEDEKQDLSMETPKIFENIIREHGKQWERLTEEEKEKYTLDFSHFIFPVINFSGVNFPQPETLLGGCIFLGHTRFNKSKFLGIVYFFDNNFFGMTRFEASKFANTLQFLGNIFFRETDFLESKFGGSSIFWRTQFLETVDFLECKFVGIADFQGCRFLGRRNFQKSVFSGELWAEKDGKGLLFSSKDVQERPSWHTVLLNPKQEKEFFNLDEKGNPQPDWTPEEKERWKIWKDHEEERNEYRKTLKAE